MNYMLTCFLKQAKTVLAMSARVEEDYKDYEISTLSLCK